MASGSVDAWAIWDPYLAIAVLMFGDGEIGVPDRPGVHRAGGHRRLRVSCGQVDEGYSVQGDFGSPQGLDRQEVSWRAADDCDLLPAEIGEAVDLTTATHEDAASRSGKAPDIDRLQARAGGQAKGHGRAANVAEVDGPCLHRLDQRRADREDIPFDLVGNVVQFARSSEKRPDRSALVAHMEDHRPLRRRLGTALEHRDEETGDQASEALQRNVSQGGQSRC